MLLECLNFLIDCLDKILIVVTCIYFVCNFYKLRNKEKVENALIKIFILKNDKRKELPIDITRKQITRSEIMGILGAFDKDSKFDIKYTSKKEFLEQITRIQQNKSDEIIIRIDKNDKFDCIL